MITRSNCGLVGQPIEEEASREVEGIDGVELDRREKSKGGKNSSRVSSSR